MGFVEGKIKIPDIEEIFLAKNYTAPLDSSDCDEFDGSPVTAGSIRSESNKNCIPSLLTTEKVLLLAVGPSSRSLGFGSNNAFRGIGNRKRCEPAQFIADFRGVVFNAFLARHEPVSCQKRGPAKQLQQPLLHKDCGKQHDVRNVKISGIRIQSSQQSLHVLTFGYSIRIHHVVNLTDAVVILE